MKNLPVAAMFATLALFFVFMCLPLGQGDALAERGVLDLRGAPSDKIYPLRGEWGFHYGKLLTPDDRLRKDDGAFITVPSSWRDFGYPRGGAATYRLVVLTDPGPLTLYMPEAGGARRLWVNGRLAWESGVASEGTDSRIAFENALIPIDSGFGELGEAKDIEITLQMSNFEFPFSGLYSAPLLGASRAMQTFFFRTRGFYCVGLGCVLIAAIYHLALFIFRRERMYQLFSIFCALYFLRALYEKNGANALLWWFPTDITGLRLFLTITLLHSASIGVFTLYVFSRDFLIRHFRPVAAYILLLVVFQCLIPRDNGFARPSIALLSLPFFLCPIVMALFSPVLRQEKWTRLYLAALVLYCVAGMLNKLIWDDELFMLGMVNNLFMILSQSLVLSRNYARAFEVVEETNANLERIVSERTQDIQTTSDAMRELTANISHDLKTPLTVLGVNLERLTEMTRERGDPEIIDAADIAWRKNLDLQRLTQNLLEVARIETGSSLYDPEWVSLSGLLEDVRDRYEGFLESRGLDLDVSCDGEAMIWLDAGKIWSVFDNILYNASRHTQDGGVTVNAEAGEDTILVTVRDTGLGIDPEHLPHIFERFYKAPSAREGAQGGIKPAKSEPSESLSFSSSGLGLYIVKNLMEAFGGSVTAESEPGAGTAIILTFRRR
jgi:signal transduction histidine kinase